VSFERLRVWWGEYGTFVIIASLLVAVMVLAPYVGAWMDIGGFGMSLLMLLEVSLIPLIVLLVWVTKNNWDMYEFSLITELYYDLVRINDENPRTRSVLGSIENNVINMMQVYQGKKKAIALPNGDSLIVIYVEKKSKKDMK